MPKIKLHIADERMLEVMDYCIANKVNDVSTQVAWCSSVGTSSTILFNIRKGKQSFTNDQIMNACRVYNISADYIFGFTPIMHMNLQKASPIDQIKSAVWELEKIANTKK